MPPEPGSPADWLRHARSGLALARTKTSDLVLRDTLCFHAQQAAEKSIKAVLVLHGIDVPKTHNLTVLVELLPAAVDRPADLPAALSLTQYAVDSRYPGAQEPIADAEFAEALRMAAAVLAWAQASLGTGSAPT